LCNIAAEGNRNCAEFALKFDGIAAAVEKEEQVRTVCRDCTPALP
jgi:hypothetical protein